MGRSVDIELADMAGELGMSTRRLMAGVMNGRHEQIGTDDLVHGDKGDPLFFRLDRGRAYSLFGENLDRVESDMSTIEQMSTSSGDELPTETETPTVHRENEGPSPTATSASEASKTANVPQARSRSQEGPSQKKSALQEVGEAALMVGGIYAAGSFLVSLFSGGQSQDAGLSGRQKRDLLDEGYRGYYQGVEYNPYDPNTEKGRLYQKGWKQGQKGMREESLLNTRPA